MGTTCGQPVKNSDIARMRNDLEKVFTGCSQLDSKIVHHYLANATGSDRFLLDAWAKCGRNDMPRRFNISLNDQARRTVTPLGLACLVAYARAWIDEAETRVLAQDQQQDSSGPAPGGDKAPRRPGPGRPPKRRPTAKRSR